MKKINRLRLVVAIVVASLCAGTALAQAIDEIVVTADFRERPASDVPASVTVLEGDQVDDLAVQHFEELINAVPNLNWSGDGNRARYFQIRGVGELEQYQGAPNPSVGFLIDDIDFSGIATIATLFDVQQVEVLRGPQGSRYGANALAGLVYLRSVEPTAEFTGRTELTAGGDGTFAGGVAVGGGISADASVMGRLSVHHHKSDGFRNNTFLGRDDTNGRKESTVRGRLKWLAGDDLVVDIAALYVDIDDGYDAFALDNSFTVLSDKPGKDAQESVGVSLRAEYAGLAGATLTSISSYADSDILFSFDADWGNGDSWAPITYDFVSVSERQRSTLSQELRLVSDGWLLGLYALDLQDEIRTLNQGKYFDPASGFADSLDDLFESDYRATSVAVFGQLDSDLGDATRLTLGLRAEHRSTDYDDSSGLRADPSESMWGGEIAVHHDHTGTLASYVSLARGYKAGGFNLGPAVPNQFRDFGAEDLWNLEAGIKASLLDDTLKINAAVFATRRGDQQVRTSFQLEPGDPTSFGFVTINVEEGDGLGAEADIRWAPSDQWSVYATIGLLSADFGKVKAPSLSNLVNRAQAHAPDYTLAAGGRYEHPGGFFAAVDVSARASFYFDVSHDQTSSAMELVNARVGYRADSWSATLWVRNLFDETYAVRGFYFGNEPPDFPNALYTRQGDPRQVGVTLDWRF